MTEGVYRTDLYLYTLAVVTLFLLMATSVAQGPWASHVYYYAPEDQGGYAGVPPDGDANMIVEETTVLDVQGYTDEGGSTDHLFELPWDHVYELTATLTWTDDQGDNDELSITILAGGRELGANSATTGETVLGLEDIDPGNYTVRVRAVDCPGLVGPSPVDRDDGNSWGLVIWAKYGVREK